MKTVDGILVLDRQLRISAVNAQALQILGQTVRVGQPLGEVLSSPAEISDMSLGDIGVDLPTGRKLSLSSSSLLAAKGQLSGYLIVLRALPVEPDGKIKPDSTELQELIGQLSAEFINTPFAEIDDGIQRAIKAIGEFA